MNTIIDHSIRCLHKVAFALFLILPLAAGAQEFAEEDWFKLHGDYCPGYDLAVDSTDHIYVVTSCSTIKYDADATEQWINPGGTFLSLDSNDNVYVLGSDLVKYNASGDDLWTAAAPLMPKALALDDNGDVYVASQKFVGGGLYDKNYDYFITKYNGVSGTVLWASQVVRDTNDNPFDIAIDSNGYVYVTGCSGSGTYYSGGNYSTIKLDPNNGDLLWTRYYRSPYIGNPEFSEAHAIAVDQNDDILVTGMSDGVGYYDFATVKYDTLGNELWIRRYESGSWDEANDLAIDSEGNIYVTGRRCTLKYDSEGNELWYTSHDLGEEANLLGNDLILGPQGYVYVTGHRNDPNDYATAKFDPEDGTVLWWAFFAGEDHGYSGTDIATAIDLDSYGNIYVTGYFASNSTGATVKYRQYHDRDGDGHVAGEDCDDFNPTIWDCNTPRSEDPVEIVGNCGETITYPAVLAGGDTMLECGICESPPEGIFLPGTAPLCIDIDLSATLVFTGEAAVCVPYNDAGMDLADEQNLRMVRCDESEKCKVIPLCTGQVDTDNNIVCGCTDQFSMFTLGTLMDSDGDTIPDLLDNCPHDINWFQEDDDGDEIGNICDNCPNVWDPTNQCSSCEGDAEPDGDVDGRDLAIFAAGQFNGEGLLGFAMNFGRNDCLPLR